MALGGGNIVGQAYIEVMPITTGFQQRLNQQLQRVQTGGGLTVPIAANTSHLQQSVQNALPKQGYKVLVSGNVKPLEDAITSTISSLTRKALTIVGVGSVIGLMISHLKDAIYGFNNVIQQARIGFETLLGSAQEADDLIEKLKIFARTTPFQFQDLVKDAQTLIAMGTAAEDVVPTLDAVGNALSGLGRMSQMPRVLFDLGQIRATGRLTGRELMNMAMQGIPVLQYLSKATGKTAEELREQMARGVRSAHGMMIDSTTAIHAILAGMEGQFGGLMQRQMSTAAGAISNFKDAEQQLLGAIGKPVFDKIVESTIGVSNVINNMAKAFSEAGKKGESGLTAVKKVFLDLFPASAQSTIRSVLNNMAKMIHDFGVIIKVVIQTTKEWATVIGGVLLKALQGWYNIIRPVTDYLAKHKTIIQDVVKAYIALKIIEVIQNLWQRSSAIIDQLIGRTVAFTAATRSSTGAIVQQTTATLAQQRAVGAALGATTLTAAGFANPMNYAANQARTMALTGRASQGMGINPATGAAMASSFASFSTVATRTTTFATQGAAATGVWAQRAQNLGTAFAGAAAKIQGGAVLAAVGLTMLKGSMDKTNTSGNIMITMGQGLAAGFAIGGKFGPAIGVIAGAFMTLKYAMDQASAAAKELKKRVDAVADIDWANFKTHLDSVYGTSASAAGTKVQSVQAVIADETTRHNAVVAALEKMQKEHPTPGSGGVLDRVSHALSKLPGAREGPEDKNIEDDPDFIALKAEEERLRHLIEQGNKDIDLTGEYGTVLQHYLDIYQGPNLPNIPKPQSTLDTLLGKKPQIFIGPTDPFAPGRKAMTDMGQTAADQKILYKDSGAPRTLAELENVKGGVDALSRAQGLLNDNTITSYDELIKWDSALNQAAIAIDAAIKAGDDWIKSQKLEFQIGHDVADANLAMIDTFRGVVDTIAEGKISIEDFITSGKGMQGDIEQTGKAVYESMIAQQRGTAEATAGAVSAQKDIIDSFVAMMQSANLTSGQIDSVLQGLGLLDMYRKITIEVDADTTAAWETLNALLAALEVTHNGFAAADFGSIAGLAGPNWDPFKGPAKVPGKDVPLPLRTPPKGGSGKDPAEAAAKALESASKGFYDTIVSAAKDFHDKVVEIMGNPAERLQQTQARSVGALIRNTDFRTAAITDWTTGLAKLRSEGLSQIAIDAMGLLKGPEMDRQVKRLLQASPAEIAKLNASLTNEAQAAQKAAYAQQGDIIAKAITAALAKFFEDAGTKPGGPGTIEIVNQITQALVDPQALALALVTQLGGKVKL